MTVRVCSACLKCSAAVWPSTIAVIQTYLIKNYLIFLKSQHTAVNEALQISDETAHFKALAVQQYILHCIAQYR